MFNWTTTTLINEIPENFIKDFGNGKLRIGKHLFEKRWVESIRKAEGHEMKLCEVKLNMSDIKGALDTAGADVARLYLYVGLEGSEESIYANDWYRKGMPLSISFAKAEASVMAKAIEETVKRFNVFTKVKKILDAKADGTNLTIKGTHEHQRIQKVAILVGGEFDNEKAISNWTLSEARYAETEGNKDTYKSQTYVELVEPGVNGFGTYSQLIKDLRLPTVHNTSWLNVNKSEIPVVGSLYTQYIITYYAPSTANPSFTAIGNRSMSETTHVFWVKSDLIADWEDALSTIDPDDDGFSTIINKHVEGLTANKDQSLVDNEYFTEK